MSQDPLCPNLNKKVQKEVSQMANRKLSCAMLYRWFKCKLKPPKNHWSFLNSTCLKALDMSNFPMKHDLPTERHNLIASSKSGYFTEHLSFGMLALTDVPSGLDPMIFRHQTNRRLNEIIIWYFLKGPCISALLHLLHNFIPKLNFVAYP